MGLLLVGKWGLVPRAHQVSRHWAQVVWARCPHLTFLPHFIPWMVSPRHGRGPCSLGGHLRPVLCQPLAASTHPGTTSSLPGTGSRAPGPCLGLPAMSPLTWEATPPHPVHLGPGHLDLPPLPTQFTGTAKTGFRIDLD